jgi:hypothetical protein
MKKHRTVSSSLAHGALGAIALASLLAAAPGCGATAAAETRSPSNRAAFVEHAQRCDRVEGGNLDAVLSGSAVRNVGPLYGATDPTRSDGPSVLFGATVTVDALPGLTAEWLNRQLSCHGAEQTLGGTAGQASDPFSLRDGFVNVDVRPARDSFEIHLTSPSHHVAHEILARAKAWAPGATVSLR